MNETVGHNLFNLVYRHSIRSLLPAMMAIPFIGYLLSLNTPGYAWLYWVIAVSLTYLLRPILLKLILSTYRLSIRQKLIIIGIYNIVISSTLAASILFFPQLDLAPRLIISLMLAGFAAGASAANAGYIPLFLCFIVPLLLPFGVTWMQNPGEYLPNDIAMMVGLLILMMIVFLTSNGHDTFRIFSAHVELSEKQSLMSAELSDALKRAEHEQNRAESSNRSKTRFLAAASHDLRQPVHVVSLFGAALETMVKQENVKEVVNDMNLAVQSLSTQLNELLDIAKLDSDTVTPEFTQIELNSVVRHVVEELWSEANAKNIEIINAVEKGVYVWSDNTKLSQILRNLVGNGIKYTDKGNVTLSVQKKDERIILSCVDTGIGISEDEQQHIFEEFYQVHNPERNKEKGIGLGLSIVERLARNLSHEISMTSKLGEGTCVSLKLKVANQATVHDQRANQEEVRALENNTFDGWVHIVDDEPSVCKSMGLLLKELGCRVTSTSSTNETVNFMGSNRPDAVLVDLRLRGNDSGIKTLNAVEAIDPSIFRVMITGETLFRLDDIGLSHDVKLLHKPVSKARIVALLKGCVNGSYKAPKS